MNSRFLTLAAGCLVLLACSDETTEPAVPSSPSLASAPSSGQVGINVVLKGKATSAQLAQLNAIGQVKRQFPEIYGLTMAAMASQLAAVRALPFVKAAALDAQIDIPPNTPLVPVSDFTGGLSTWNQDAINATVSPLSATRGVVQTGAGVWVGILDTGLLFTWPQYFPTSRISAQYATTFTGGGALDAGNVTQRAGDAWQHDVCAHGTHVTSTVLGYQIVPTVRFQGTAPQATVIPVKLSTQGSPSSQNRSPCGFPSSVAAAGLLYFGQLKEGPLAGQPLVVNNSWGSRNNDPLVEAAVNFALQQGVLLVFSAGNGGANGMGYPGALPQVISAAASGWTHEWVPDGNWWFTQDVADPINANDFYITSFSGRQLTGQDLDIAAPGSWVVGPYQLQRGRTDFFFLGGTSEAAPHVTGTVALMLQKNPNLTEAQAEAIIEGSAVPLGAGCRQVILVPLTPPAVQICWGADATGAGLLNAAAAVAATP
ncbi:MAG TPA: S8 family serine peptidase [Gemmatimonadales bacterium]|nr:S8 family serine peptidase [Gemmatimonadales bacterium]